MSSEPVEIPIRTPVDHERLLEAIESRVSYRQFAMVVGAIWVLLGAAFAYHSGQPWHPEGGELLIRAANDAQRNRESVEQMRSGQSRIESKVDEIRGFVRGNGRDGD